MMKIGDRNDLTVIMSRSSVRSLDPRLGKPCENLKQQKYLTVFDSEVAAPRQSPVVSEVWAGAVSGQETVL